MHHVPRRQPTPPERSPEERARAAADRAARRGESAPPPETFLARSAGPPEPAPATDEDPFRVARARPEPAAPQPEPEPEGSWFNAEPEAAGDGATQEFRPDWLDEEELEPVAPAPAPRDGLLPRRAKAREEAGRFAPAAGPRGRELPPRGPQRSLGGGGNGRRPLRAPRRRSGRRVLALLALALVGGAL